MNVSPGDVATYHGPNESARRLIFDVLGPSPQFVDAWRVRAKYGTWVCPSTGTIGNLGTAPDRYLRKLTDPDADSQVKRGREVVA